MILERFSDFFLSLWKCINPWLNHCRTMAMNRRKSMVDYSQGTPAGQRTVLCFLTPKKSCVREYPCPLEFFFMRCQCASLPAPIRDVGFWDQKDITSAPPQAG